MNKGSSFRKTGLAVIFVLALVAIFFWQFQKISDWFKLLGYTPPPNIVQLANQDTMTGYTKHLFYLNKPELISNVSTFRQACPEDKQTIVLGCYHPGQNGIFIFSVNDPKLYGLEQVTAAHEVLHAIYARLTDQQRLSLDSELMNFYKHGLHDKLVLGEVKLYQQTEPSDVYDEMSCTFGTELTILPNDLEAYYAKYFTNRLAIVGYENRYNAAFLSLQNQIDSYENQLKSLQSTINSDETELESELTSINSNRAKLDAYQQSGNINTYNAEVPEFNDEVQNYNSGLNNLRAEISQYNSIVKIHNSLASELGSLDSEIDTRLSTQSTR